MEFLERDMHCFTHFNGMGMVHQQFLHALGMVGEHQRADAADFFTVQPQNIDLEQSEIDQRFSAITLDQGSAINPGIPLGFGIPFQNLGFWIPFRSLEFRIGISDLFSESGICDWDLVFMLIPQKPTIIK